MSMPLNDLDYGRLLQISQLIRKHALDAEISIYVSGDHASIELSGHGIPAGKLREVLAAETTVNDVGGWPL